MKKLFTLLAIMMMVIAAQAADANTLRQLHKNDKVMSPSRKAAAAQSKARMAKAAQVGNVILKDSVVGFSAEDDSKEYKYVFTYDNKGICTCEEDYNYSEGQWVADSKYEYEYDDNGNCTLEIDYEWSDEVWNYTDKYVSTYNADGKETYYASYDYIDNDWVLYHEITTTYEEKGGRSTRSDKWPTSSPTTTDYIYDNTYNAKGLVASEITFQKNGETWTNTDKREYTYNDNGKITTEKHDKYSSNTWNNYYYYKYEYNNAGKCTLEEDQKWENDAWATTEKYTYSYDDNGYETEECDWYRNSNTKVLYLDSKYVYTNDKYGHLRCDCYYNEDGEMVLSEYEIYYYPTHTALEKFSVTTTFENTDGTSKETIKASVDKDFVVKVTLPAKDVKMYANKVTATATMKGITGFGMKEDETRTHSKTVTSDRAESIVLSDEIQHVYEFEGEKHFDVKVGDVDKFEYAVKFATEADGTKTITATPSDAALAHQAWSEITSRLDAKTLDSKATGCVMKAGSYVKNNNEMIKFTKDATFTGENLRQNLETMNLATCAYSIAEIKAVEFALAPESKLTIGQTSLTLKPEKAITVTVANDDKTAYVPGKFLTDMKKDLISLVNIASDSEMKKQLIKNVLGYMKTIDSAVSGKRNVTVTVTFDKATAIQNVNASTSSAQAQDGKFIENGKVVIVKNGQRYNAAGQRLK